MRDSYVVLKDSRRFISSHTAMLSEEGFAVSSSRSAVLECETERGKRHIYIGERKLPEEDARVHKPWQLHTDASARLERVFSAKLSCISKAWKEQLFQGDVLAKGRWLSKFLFVRRKPSCWRAPHRSADNE